MIVLRPKAKIRWQQLIGGGREETNILLDIHEEVWWNKNLANISDFKSQTNIRGQVNCRLGWGEIHDKR